MQNFPLSNKQILLLTQGWATEDRENFAVHFYTVIVNYALRFGLNEHDAAEVAWKTIDKVCARIDEFDPTRGDFWTYGRGFVFNTVREHRRKKKIDGVPLDQDVASGEDFEKGVWQREILEKAHTYIMSHGMNGAMAWERFNGREYTEIAEAFDVPVPRVYLAVSRIRAIMRDHELNNQLED